MDPLYSCPLLGIGALADGRQGKLDAIASERYLDADDVTCLER